MTVHRHSVESLSLFEPELSNQERRVWWYVRDNTPCTRQEIAAGTGIPLASVCGRVKSLLDAGYLVAVGAERHEVNGRSMPRELLAVSA